MFLFNKKYEHISVVINGETTYDVFYKASYKITSNGTLIVEGKSEENNNKNRVYAHGTWLKVFNW